MHEYDGMPVDVIAGRELLIGKLEGVPEVTELRVDISYPVRLIWVCGKHDHRWRWSAWLCRLVK